MCVLEQPLSPSGTDLSSSCKVPQLLKTREAGPFEKENSIFKAKFPTLLVRSTFEQLLQETGLKLGTQ